MDTNTIVLIAAIVFVCFLLYKGIFVNRKKAENKLDNQVQTTSSKLNKAFIIFGGTLIIAFLLLMVMDKY